MRGETGIAKKAVDSVEKNGLTYRSKFERMGAWVIKKIQ